MTYLEALILGLLQGITEFLPVSSSGHLEIAKVLLGVELKEELTFTVVVHGATVLSTIVVFWKDICHLLGGLFKFKWNEETIYIAKIALSMLPVAFIGLFFKAQVESLFGNGLLLVGCMLILTALLLTLANFWASGKHEIGFKDAFIIGIAQAVAVLPGLSRSGTTIATGLLLGNKKESVARFSFLMVLVPILGENFLSLLEGNISMASADLMPLVIGFVAAFLAGWLACKFMINIVKKGKLIYFAIYCAIVGTLAIVF
ncbi:MAG: undecaprenyl-diphosphate phosphatase [Bacteroidales bacterium]